MNDKAPEGRQRFRGIIAIIIKPLPPLRGFHKFFLSLTHGSRRGLYSAAAYGGSSSSPLFLSLKNSLAFRRAAELT
jgi:hypothetical protein